MNLKRKLSGLLSVILALAMVAAILPAVPIVEVEAAAGGQRYDDEINALTPEEYADFGLSNNSPKEFDPNDTSNPLGEYETSYKPMELFVGYGNKQNAWDKEFFVADNPTQLSKDALNLDSLDKIGGKFKLEYVLDSQILAECGADIDGDGTDELIVALIGAAHGDTFIEVYGYDYDENGRQWKERYVIDYPLYNYHDYGMKDNWGWGADIRCGSQMCLTSLTAGDFDGDGMDEMAIYVPSQLQEITAGESDSSIVIADFNGSFSKRTVMDRICLKELGDADNSYNVNINDWKYPIVSLSTTSISGQDDLVINVSKPLMSGGAYSGSGQSSVLAIYHYGQPRFNLRYKKTLVYGNTRMRFASAVDTDVDGNGIEELAVGGYKNAEWNTNNDVGKLDPSKNLIQLICWNESAQKYEEVWSTPKEVEAHSDLSTNTDMTEPAALAAGKFHSFNNADQIFLEGNIFRFSGAAATGTSEKDRLLSGTFTKEYSMALGGLNNAFISTAYAGLFSTAAAGTEQLVVLSGDYKANDSGVTYLDVSWVWEDSDGKLTGAVTNNDYLNGRATTGSGTFMTLCPVNVDDDATVVKYDGKTYGWSDPALYCVLQSPPYWSELPYNSETFGAGEVAYKISYGNGSGLETEYGVGLGVFLNVSFVAGPKFMGNGAKAGMGFEAAAMASYVGSYADKHMDTDSVEIKAAPGEDHVVMLAVPLVIYHYQVWVPEYVVTQEHIDNYNEICKQMGITKPGPDQQYPYKVGDIVPGSWQEYTVQMTLSPSFSCLPVEEYNELVKEYGNKTELKPIEEGTFASKTIGDPSTYPHSVDELKTGKENNLHVSPNAVTTQIGESVKTLTYEHETETERSDGFSLGFDGKLYSKDEINGKIPFVAEADIDIEMGLQLAGDAGCSWISSNTEGMEFTATMADLPKGSENYTFATQMAVFNNTDLPMGEGKSSGAYAIGYIVAGVDANSAPPKLPLDVRVYGTTTSGAILKWDASTYRGASSYKVYIEDNTGQAKLIGTTENTYYVATNLDPSTQYRFAVQSCSKKNGVDYTSVMSRWVTAITKDSSDASPYFTTQPRSVVKPDEDTQALTAEAHVGDGMDGATLSYQWQVYSNNSLTGEGVWSDIEGATGTTYPLPEVTRENASEFPEQTHYRAVVTQMKGSNVKSTISKIATMYVNRDGSAHDFYRIDMEMMVPDPEVEEVNGEYFTESGKVDLAVDISPAEDGGKTPVKGDIVVMCRENGEEQGIAGRGGITNGTPDVISVSSLPVGIYELYAVYAGGSPDGSEDNKSYYLPAQSDNVITLHVVNDYHITYHLNGGINNPENPTVLTNESPAVELKAPTKNYYNFEGWYLDEGFTKPLENNTLDSSTLTDDVDLYAKWTPIAYAISYELNGGENSVDNPASYTIEDTVMLQDAAREGYIFAGWYLDKEFTDGPVEKIDGSTCADVTLYAKWEEEETPFDQDQNGTYLISSYADLVAMAQKIQTNPDRYANAKYVQTCNINCEEQAWELPIGTEEHPFNGTYEGYDYYVLGLRQTGGKIGGLFGVIGEEGIVQNLSVVDFDYSEPTEIAGGLAGINQGTIVGCGNGINISSSAIIFRNGQPVPISTLNSDVNGTVSGGLVGRNEGIIQDSRSNAVVNGSVAGGITGENAGRISNIYNTGTVTGTAGTEAVAGGIAGRNLGTGKDADAGSIQYGYSNKVVSGSVIGGIAGTSDNTNIQDVWYLSDMAQACGNQEDAVLLAVQMTADEMKSQAFCDILNNAVSTQQEELGLRNWTWNSGENEGYPRIEKVIVVQQTLSNTQYGISVSGQIHPGARLQIEKVSGKKAVSKTIEEVLHSGTLLEEWYLALVYEDGTHATWEGDLTVSIKPETKEKLNNLRIFHLNDANECSELETSNEGEYLIAKTKTLGSFGVVLSESGSQTEKPGSIKGSPGSEEAGNVENAENAGGTNQKSSVTNTGGTKQKSSGTSTGDMADLVVPLCALLVSGTVIVMIIRKRKYHIV